MFKDSSLHIAARDSIAWWKAWLVRLIAVLLSLIVCAIVVLRMLMDTTMKTVDDIDRYLHLPVLAAVPYYREMDRK